ISTTGSRARRGKHGSIGASSVLIWLGASVTNSARPQTTDQWPRTVTDLTSGKWAARSAMWLRHLSCQQRQALVKQRMCITRFRLYFPPTYQNESGLSTESVA